MKKSLTITILLLALFFHLGIYKFLDHRPGSIHIWAQCDRASVARNFSEDSMNILLPRVHHTKHATGITGMEFPLINYIVAVFYKLFGFNEFWYRSVMALLVFAGLFAAIRMFNLFVPDLYASVLLVAIWYLSPTLVYYTPNFLPDAASLGLILIFWMLFFRIVKTGKSQLLPLLALTAALSGLIKISSLISVITVIIIGVINLLLPEHRRSINGKLNLKITLYSVTALPIVLCWYLYAANLNTTYQSGVFLMDIKPAENLTEFFRLASNVWETQNKQYYFNLFFIFLGIAAFYIAFNYKKVNRILLQSTLLLWMGSTLFFIMMIHQFIHHDYYIITLLPAALFLLLTAAELLFRITRFRYLSLTSGIVLLLIFLIFSNQTNKKTKGKLEDLADTTSEYKYYNVYYGMENYLRKIGIRRDQRVLSVFDVSPNVTLYLMDQKGLNVNHGNDPYETLKDWQLSPEYIIVNEKHRHDFVLRDSSAFEKVGQYKHLRVYRILPKCNPDGVLNPVGVHQGFSRSPEE